MIGGSTDVEKAVAVGKELDLVTAERNGVTEGQGGSEEFWVTNGKCVPKMIFKGLAASEFLFIINPFPAITGLTVALR